jgi:hypothetical protein
MTETAAPRLVPIHVPDGVLDDLGVRLKATRWPRDAGNEDGYYGVLLAYLRELVEYWIDGYDWRAAEAEINAYQHYRVDVGGVPVHFMRRPGVGPDPTPLILSHGWPWTFWHWSKVIDPLADPGRVRGRPGRGVRRDRAVAARLRVLHPADRSPRHELLEDRRRLARADDRRARPPEVRGRRM